MACVYKITRNDGLEYIGITNNLKRRIQQHIRSPRFSVGIKHTEILFESEYKNCEDAEEIYITVFDTYKNGLNTTLHGKGNHYDSSRFNTLGYVYSKESRERMSKAKDGFVPWNKGKSGYWTPNEEWIDKHRFIGSDNPKSILNEDLVREIIEDFISSPKIDNVGQIQKNGKPMSYMWAYCLQKAPQHNMTPQAIRRLLEKKSWKNVWKEYEV